MDELAASNDDLVASELVRFELFADASDSELPGIEGFFPVSSGCPLARRSRRSVECWHGAIDRAMEGSRTSTT
jgi:hypothetical protein